MMHLYSIGIWIYGNILWIASLFSDKAKKWRAGRQKQKPWPPLKNPIWFHCASLGEFEQARPVIEGLKAMRPDLSILLTFFSPSGFEPQQNYAYADLVLYLPLDTEANAKAWIRHFQPKALILTKYDLWFHTIRRAQSHSIPVILISAQFRKGQFFFKRWGSVYLKYLRAMDRIFVQTQESANLLHPYQFSNYEVNGDTRIDRVLQIQKDTWSDSIIEEFTEGRRILIMGSSWEPEEKLFQSSLKAGTMPNWKYIIAPHDVSRSHITQLTNRLQGRCILYSQFEETSADILIIDKIGILSRLYRYGDIAWIGGGFGTGIHNILEPMAYGLPILFGPNYQKFPEAVAMVKKQGAFVIRNLDDLQQTLNRLQTKEAYQKSREVILDYLEHNRNATTSILNYLTKLIP